MRNGDGDQKSLKRENFFNFAMERCCLLGKPFNGRLQHPESVGHISPSGSFNVIEKGPTATAGPFL
jgi:hypothetical protein